MNDCNYTRIRRQLLIRLVQEYLAGTLAKNIDSIPVEMRPRKDEAMRCCIYKDRAVLKYRLMALLGLGVEDEIDESKTLASYVSDAEKRESLDENVLSVVDVACHG